MNRFQAFIVLLFLTSSMFLKAQEKVCIPNVWKPEMIKGTIYKTDGDSLSGKFLNLTPYNDIHTTHIVYKASKQSVNISRFEIKAYYDKKKNEYRLKVYVDADSVNTKKGCFFDMGKFLLVIDSGKYILLKDELNYYSSIDAYSQSNVDEVYYILPPDKRLIKVQINSLRAQMMSLFPKEEVADFLIGDNEMTIPEMIELVRSVNSDQSRR
jgi:hypothetical protein